MKRTLFFGCLIAVMTLGATAQKAGDSVWVYIPVQDAFTGAIIEDGSVEVLTPDSALVCHGEWGYNENNGVRTRSSVDFTVANHRDYIVRVTHPDYLPVHLAIKVNAISRGSHRPNLTPVENIRMTRRPKTRVLGEATAKATKIKMFHKGDTLVYNADAFSLSQGSMLDALIEQLPGAELKDNGVITVNGKPVSSLYVNGRDFFRGDPRIALENLPAYMVDRIKVYEKADVMERLSGVKQENRPLVMDVNLKKQYSIGWIANAEAAYGTHGRYLGRLFALRFTDCSRMALFGNMNNTNDTRRPGQRGDWTPSYLPSGLQAAKTAGAEYSYQNRKKDFDWTSNATVSHTDNTTFTRQTTERFLPVGTAQSISRQVANNCNTSFNTNHNIKRQLENSNHEASFHYNYDYSEGETCARLAEFAGNPYLHSETALDDIFRPGSNTLYTIARHRQATDARTEGENWSVSLPYIFFSRPFRKKGLSDIIFIRTSASYDKHRSLLFDHYRLDYFDANQSVDFRNRYLHRPSEKFNLKAEAGYSFYLGPTQYKLEYRYSHQYSAGRRDLFRFDRLDGWETDAAPELGLLPSMQSVMQQALDIQNSEHSSTWRTLHQPEFFTQYRSRADLSFRYTLILPLNIDRQRLRYDRAGQNFNLRRTKVYLEPHLTLELQDHVHEKTSVNHALDYNLRKSLPSLRSGIALINDINPLYVETGNPNLRASDTHSLEYRINTWKGWNKTNSITIGYITTRHAQAMARTYNSATGGYNVCPINVNGNWSLNGDWTFNHKLDKKKRWSGTLTTSATFINNVDMDFVAGTESMASSVRNLYLSERYSVYGDWGKLHLSGKLRGAWHHVTSPRAGFSTINAADLSAGVTLRTTLPGKIGLSTDFTAFGRTGYDDESLNSVDWVWNARLERSILNGNLTFALDGFDILHSLSQVTRIINAQGRTETFTNVIPSYMMLHALYRLNKQPKKKK